jgi:hypothetical protein
MNQKSNPLTEGMGLLANGSSGRWDIAVDESLDRDEWSMELDGRNTYLVFQLQDLSVIPRVLQFLQSGAAAKHAPGRHDGEEGGRLTLGRFGSEPVSLVWDNEDFQRCFLVVGARGLSTLRLSLEAEEIPMLIEALSQVVAELPPVAGV